MSDKENDSLSDLLFCFVKVSGEPRAIREEENDLINGSYINVKDSTKKAYRNH